MPCRLICSRTFVVSVLAGFLLLSLADLYLTWYLIAPKGDAVLESNPLAQFVYEVSGWPGMTAYKLSLVVVIGLAVLVVTRQRPRAAELVLTFGCGAQAAVVMSSIFLLCSIEKYRAGFGQATPAIAAPHPNGDGFAPDAIALLMQAPIQVDLGVSSTQVRDIMSAALRAQALRLRLPAAASDDLRDLAAEIRCLERSMLGKLSVQQKHRLMQLSWQHRGALAFGDGEVSTALELTSQQSQVALPLLEEARNWARSPTNRRRDIAEGGASLDQIKSQLVELLTAEQRERWIQLMGKPFQFEVQLGLRDVEQLHHIAD